MNHFLKMRHQFMDLIQKPEYDWKKKATFILLNEEITVETITLD